MPLSVDTRKITKAEIVPWERTEGIYGIAYTTEDGQHGADRIGSKQEAQALMKTIGDAQNGSAPAGAGPFPKDIAAS